jgi:hypothetical protein
MVMAISGEDFCGAERAMRLASHEQPSDMGCHRQFPGPPGRSFDVSDGSDAEYLQALRRPSKDADCLDHCHADRVVCPHAAVDEFNLIRGIMWRQKCRSRGGGHRGIYANCLKSVSSRG